MASSARSRTATERRVDERTARLARATQEIEDLVHIVPRPQERRRGGDQRPLASWSRAGGNLSERGKVLRGQRPRRRPHDVPHARGPPAPVPSPRAPEPAPSGSTSTPSSGSRCGSSSTRSKRSASRSPWDPCRRSLRTPKMRHIFDNLLNNACKYVRGQAGEDRRRQGEVNNGTTVKFFVRDNGVGMDERQRAWFPALPSRTGSGGGGAVQDDTASASRSSSGSSSAAGEHRGEERGSRGHDVRHASAR